MRTYGRYAFFGVCLLFITLCGIKGNLVFSSGSNLVKNVTIINQDGTYELDSLKQAEKSIEDTSQTPMDFTVWGEKTGEAVSTLEGLKQTTVSVLSIYGSSELLLPYGKILQKEDLEGCLLGEKTAEKLFGSHKVEGESVQYQGKEFQIRGVLSEPEEILVIQKSAAGDGTLNRITVKAQKGRRVSETVSAFKSKYGLSGEVLRFDFYQNFNWLVELIPGKWSDFDGWTQNMEEKTQEFSLLSGVQKSTMEVLYLTKIKQGIFYMVFAILLFFGIIWVLGAKAYKTGIFKFRKHSIIKNKEIGSGRYEKNNRNND